MKKKFFVIPIIVFLSYFIVNNSFTQLYITQLKDETAMKVDKNVDPLHIEITDKAREYEIPPVNAQIDPVWKKIPGYNGLKVDIVASYNKMKKDETFDPDKLVFIETKPEIKLKDLPPAPIYKGNPEKPSVSFIINVAWGNEYIPEILAILKENRVFATFFLEGNWVKKNPELAKMIASAGHEVGNHSFSHPDMKMLSAGKVREEIKRTNEVIKATTGKTVTLFAPPSGSFRDEVVKIAAEEELETILWTVDTIDWRNPNPETIIHRVLTKVHNGALILMHPTESTTKALDRLIKGIKEKNLSIQPVSKLLSEERITKRDGKGKRIDD